MTFTRKRHLGTTVLAIAALALTACGGDSEPEPSTSNTVPPLTTPTETGESVGEVTVTCTSEASEVDCSESHDSESVVIDSLTEDQIATDAFGDNGSEETCEHYIDPPNSGRISNSGYMGSFGDYTVTCSISFNPSVTGQQIETESIDLSDKPERSEPREEPDDDEVSSDPEDVGTPASASFDTLVAEGSVSFQKNDPTFEETDLLIAAFRDVGWEVEEEFGGVKATFLSSSAAESRAIREQATSIATAAGWFVDESTFNSPEWDVRYAAAEYVRVAHHHGLPTSEQTAAFSEQWEVTSIELMGDPPQSARVNTPAECIAVFPNGFGVSSTNC